MYYPIGWLQEGKIYNTRNGKTVRVIRVIGYTAYCSDGRNRSNVSADCGIVNSSIYSKDLDIVGPK